MLFVEFVFLAFFAVAFSVYWSLKSNKSRKTWLLLCSYVFYSGWDWRFSFLIAASTAVDFLVARALARDGQSDRKRRFLLYLSLAANLGMLGLFKYMGFFLESLGDLFAVFGLGVELPALSLVLPVGLSFYTFQSMSYTLDVYHKRLRPVESPWDFALFVSFFPQLVAGPIVRASAFLPQLFEARRMVNVRWRHNLVLFIHGFFKKACVADLLAYSVDVFYASPVGSFDTFSTVLAIIFFAVQIYADFSGYSDMAIATAGFLGYDLGDNFRFPFFSKNPNEIWTRWHISLSTWIRDYLFVPLGGFARTRWRHHKALMSTMLIMGIWHGAGWKFMVWGALFGVFQLIHWNVRSYSHKRRKRLGLKMVRSTTWDPLKIAGTFALFCMIDVFFRANSIEHAFWVCWSVVAPSENPTLALDPRAGLFLLGLGILHYFSFKGWVNRAWQSLGPYSFAAAYGFIFSLCIAASSLDSRPFVYFQF